MPQETEQAEEKSSPRKTLSVPLTERLGFSIPEFAAAFGKGRVWGYRQVYSGRVKILSPEHGEMIVPRSEVEAFLGAAAPFNPKPDQSRRGRKPKGATAELQPAMG